MKKFASLLAILVPLLVCAQVPPPPAATQAEVNAGVLHNKYVAPDTLKNSSGGGTNSYTLPPATTNSLGGVIPDGTTITVDGTGKISTSGVAGTNSIDATDLVLNTIYTNTASSSNLVVYTSVFMPATASAHAVGLFIDNDHNGTYESRLIVSNADITADDVRVVSFAVKPLGVYTITNMLGANNSVVSFASERVYSSIGGGGGGSSGGGTNLLQSQLNKIANAQTNQPYTFYLDPTRGNDSTAVIGNPNLAWGSLTGIVAAVGAGLPNATIYMLPGTNYIGTNQFPNYPTELLVPANTVFTGSGQKQSFITQSTPGFNSSGWLAFQDNSELDDFSFIDTNADPNSAVIPIYLGSQSSCTNTVLNRVYINGASDGIFLGRLNPQVGFPINVIGNDIKIISKWDCVNQVTTNGLSVISTWNNPDFEAYNVGYSLQVRAVNCSAGLVNVNGGTCVISNQNAFASGGIMCSYQNGNLTGGSINFNSTLTVISNVSGNAFYTRNTTNTLNIFAPQNLPQSSYVSLQGKRIFFAMGASAQLGTNAPFAGAFLTTADALNNTWTANASTLTNVQSSAIVIPPIQAGRTNVALVGATTLFISLPSPMPSTNYTPFLTANGAAVPGFFPSNLQTNGFTSNMTALTLTGNLLWSVIGHLQ